jgi:hypothetical protein
MGFGVLFLLLLVTAGWWLHSRWSALARCQAARREAEMMFIMEARLNAAGKAGPKPPRRPPSDFYPTCPASDAPGRAAPRHAASSRRVVRRLRFEPGPLQLRLRRAHASAALALGFGCTRARSR